MYRYTVLRYRPATSNNLKGSLVSTIVYPLCFGHRGACVVPHPSKAYRGGEDAYVLHRTALGVADGVGGYARHGIDPGRYTRFLMQSVLQQIHKEEKEEYERTALLRRHNNNTSGDIQEQVNEINSQSVRRNAGKEKNRALRLLEEAYEITQRRGQPGGCPVTLAAFTPTALHTQTSNSDVASLSVCHLGDCGLLQVRQGKLVFLTSPQQHEFNCPFQLPDDRPASGQQYDLPVHHGDVFLCASDGVWDNVETAALVELLSLVGQCDCVTVAQKIGALAARNAQDKHYHSPFAQHAAEAGYQYRGGKVDDITVLVVQTMKTEEENISNDSEKSGEGAASESRCSPPLITELLGLPPCPP